MDLDRLSTGEKIAGLSGVLLFIFMFFDWFTVDISGGEGLFSVSVGGSAWDALDVIPIILMLAVIAAVAVAIIRLTDAVFEPPVSVNAVVAILGALSVLLILYRIIDPPSAGDVPGVDVNPALGIFLGLIAAVGIAYGGYRAMQEEGTTFGDIGDQFSNRGGPGAGGGPTHQPPSSTTPPPPPPPPSSGQGGPPPQ
ncbi:MAG: hypothetical protein M3Y75_05095 [Actinomycetota bacterium]|nr:hypothetical protein [Actinomycetota bacterium]